MRGQRCIHCLSYDVPPDAPSPCCGRCAVLLQDLGDDVVDPPAREAGSDDERPASKAKRPHDGKWLAWAAQKRQQTRWFHAYGVEHGYPHDLRRWSLHMVERAVAAKIADKP